MEKELKLKIREQLNKIEDMIERNEEKSKIEMERKKLDEMLIKYLKNI